MVIQIMQGFVFTALLIAATVNAKESKMYDLCVVGAGMIGSAAARHASASPGIKVCLIGPNEPETDAEMKSRDIFGAYYDEGRITRVLDEKYPWQVLARKSIERYRDLERLSGIPFYTPVGYMYVGQQGDGVMDELKSVVALNNLPVQDLSDPIIQKAKFPFLKFSDDEDVLLDTGGAGHISPRNMVKAQIIVAEKQGCTVIPDVVDEVTEEKDGLKLTTSSGQVVRSKRVLIATGAFTPFRQLLPNNTRMMPDMKFCRETIALYELPEDEARRLISMPSMYYYRYTDKGDRPAAGAYILPPIKYPDGKWYLKVGDGEFANKSVDIDTLKNWYLSDGDPGVIKTNTRVITELIPGLKILSIKGKSCCTVYASSGYQYVDMVTPKMGVAIVGNGVSAKMSDELGRIAAEMIVNGRWDSELPQSLFKMQWKPISKL